MNNQKSIVIFSERDRFIFTDLFNFISAGLIAFAIQKIIQYGFVDGWWYEILVAFALVSINYKFINKKSDTKK